MTCRTIEATMALRPYPEGGSSHGDTCCLCGRPFESVDHGTGRRIYVQVSVGRDACHVSSMPRDQWPADAGRDQWHLQADSEGCASILARWMALAYHDRERSLVGYMICLAHTCTAVVGPDGGLTTD